MNRRQFFSKGAAAGASLRTLTVMSGFGVLAGPAAAFQDPATIVTIAQMAIRVASLLGNSGPSEMDLQNLQVEMMRNIAGEVMLIQSGLLLLFNQLEQIKKLVRDLPDNTVLSLYREKLAGLIREYAELMSVYAEDVRSQGIKYAQGNAKQALPEVINGFRKVRGVIYDFPSELVIPIVCTSLQAETHAMIMADYPSSNRTVAREWYWNWLRPFVESGNPLSLGDRKSQIESGIQKTMDELDKEVVIAEESYCSFGILKAVWNDHPAPIQARAIKSFRKIPQVSASQTQVQASYVGLLAAGASIPKTFQNYQAAGVEAVSAPGSAGMLNTDPSLRICPRDGTDPQSFVNAIKIPIDEKISSLEPAQLQYVATISLLLCANSALNFITKIERATLPNAKP